MAARAYAQMTFFFNVYSVYIRSMTFFRCSVSRVCRGILDFCELIKRLIHPGIYLFTVTHHLLSPSLNEELGHYLELLSMHV